MRQIFEKEGFTPTDDADIADVILVNSCTVTHDADSKLFKCLRRIRREQSSAVLVLTGCYPQSHETDGIDADIITGTKDRSALPGLVRRFLQERSPALYIPAYKAGDVFEDISAQTIHGHTRAFIKIQDGCTMNCTYCIIPRARGYMRSKPLDEIRRQASSFAANGYREIILIGINLMFYGKKEGIDLADAVEACCTDGIERIRLGSIEPEMLERNTLIRMKSTGHFCPSFHLSLQSGCDRILHEMGRSYDTAAFERTVDMCREIFPDCGITADIMTGFPGETEEDHAASLAFVKKIGFSDLQVFAYSPREGTPAAARTDQVPGSIKKRRAAEISAAGMACRHDFYEKMLGSTVPVLTERPAADGIPHGHAPNGAHVKIFTENSEKCLPNSIFYVTIDSVGECFCSGRI